MNEEYQNVRFKKLQQKYDDAIECKYGDFFIVALNGKYGLVHYAKGEIIATKYDAISTQYHYNSQLESWLWSAFVTINGKMGVIDVTEGRVKEVIPCIYDEIMPFDEEEMVGICITKSKLKVFKKQQWGFIDYNGQEIIAPKFEQIIYPFIKGGAYVKCNGEAFFIDKAGERISYDIPNEYYQQAKTLYDNVSQLNEYFRQNDSHYQTKNKDLTLFYWYAPYNLSLLENKPENYDYQEEYKSYNQLRAKMRLEQVDDLDELLQQERHRPLLTVNFESSIKTTRYKGKAEICFVILLENERVYLTRTITLYSSYVEMVLDSKSFDFNNLTDEDVQHFNLLLQYVERACNDLEIYTEQNQGIFVHQDFNVEDDIARLIELLDLKQNLSKRERNKIKKDYLELVNHSDKFRKKLEKLFDLEKDELEDVENDYLSYLLLTYYIEHYADDWKFDFEALSDFITDNIQQPFMINSDDYKQGIRHINENLESESIYSLLDIVSGNDDCHYIVVKTEDKNEILILSKRLNLTIGDV
ncbi:WG repeat-containing protein [Ursidibacter arcticus]